jgi:hypothetical protein
MDQDFPKICDEIWNGLPFDTIFAASMSAGEMLKIPCPFNISMVTNTSKLALFPTLPLGTIVSLGVGGLMVKYGIVAEPFQMPVVARIKETDISKLREAAIRIRDAYFFSKAINIARLAKVQ